METKEFKIRCSAIGEVMANARSKNEILGQTAKNHLELWKKEQIFDRKKNVRSKFLTKGILQEQEAIDLLNAFNFSTFEKNEKFFENDFMTGTPDIISDKKIIDIKCSWDFSTFPIFDKELKNKNYFYQMQGYMALTGCTNAQVVYVLVNTPLFLIEREARGMSADFGCDYDEVLAETIENMTYDDVEIENRIKIFEVERDDDVIAEIEQRVLECRTFLLTL